MTQCRALVCYQIYTCVTVNICDGQSINQLIVDRQPFRASASASGTRLCASTCRWHCQPTVIVTRPDDAAILLTLSTLTMQCLSWGHMGFAYHGAPWDLTANMHLRCIATTCRQLIKEQAGYASLNYVLPRPLHCIRGCAVASVRPWPVSCSWSAPRMVPCYH